MSCIAGVCGTGLGVSIAQPGDPDNNSILSATPAFGGIDVTWTYPSTNPEGVAFIILYRGLSADFTSAIRHATVNGTSFYDKITGDLAITYYYWIQIVSVNGTYAPAIGPASARANPPLQDVLVGLTAQIDQGHLSLQLKSEIDQITTSAAAIQQEITDRIAAANTLAASQAATQAHADETRRLLLGEVNDRMAALEALVLQVNDYYSYAQDTQAQLAASTADAQAALNAEIAARTTAIVNVLTTVQAHRDEAQATQALLVQVQNLRQDGDSALASRLDLLATEVGDNTAAILEENSTRADALGAEASQRETLAAVLTGQADPAVSLDQLTGPSLVLDFLRGDYQVFQPLTLEMLNSGLLYQERLTRSSETAALASQINTVSASVVDNVVVIRNEETARIDGDTALGQQITQVVGTVDANLVALNDEITLRIDADTALGKRIDSSLVAVNDAVARIAAEETTRASETDALAQQLTKLGTTVNGNTTAIANEVTARSDAVSAEAEQRNKLVTSLLGSTDLSETLAELSGPSLVLDFTQGLYQLWGSLSSGAVQGGVFATEQKARTDAVNSLAEQLTTLYATYQTNAASVAQQLQTLSDGQTAQAGEITQLTTTVDGKANSTTVTDLTSRVSTVEDTVSSQGTDLTLLQNSINQKADASALTAITQRVTNDEATLSSQGSAITALQNNLLDGDFDAFQTWQFDTDGNNESWAGSGLNLSTSGGKLHVVGSAPDPQLISPLLSLAGVTFTHVRVKITRVAGSSWDGTLYYATAGHSWSGSYRKVLPNPNLTVGASIVLEWDMSQLSAGGTDWVDNLITRLRFDLGTGATDSFDIDWISIGRKAPAASATALNNLTTRVTNTEGILTSQSSSITALQSSLGDTNNNVANAQAAADAAAGLAGSKGKVLVQAATPVVADQLEQNLWIDLTNGANTPKRWDGSAWTVVTDKVATDAATAAANALSVANSKADASAVSSLESTVTSQGNTLTSQGSRITSLENSVNSTTSGLATKASTTALTSLDSKVTQQGKSITAVSQSVTQLSSTVKGNTAAINSTSQTVSDLSGGLSATMTLRAQVTADGQTYAAGWAAGVEHTSDGYLTQMLFQADRFAVINVANGAITSPFVIQNGQVFMNSAVISQADIINLIVTGTLQSADYVPGQSGIRINFVTSEFEMNGSVSGKGRMMINNRALKFWDANNVLRAQFGDLEA